MADPPDDKHGVSLVDASELRDDAYRAIGRYTVEFSLLVAGMRQIIAGHVATEETRELAYLALGSLMAQDIADAFFAICRAATDLDPDEQAIEKCLRTKQVKDEIEERNRIMHGDWLIARWTRDDFQAPTAARVRVSARNVKEPFQQRKFKVEEIDKLAERVGALKNIVWEFGTVCTEQWDHDPAKGRPKERVRDALEIVDGRVIAKPGDRTVPWPPH